MKTANRGARSSSVLLRYAAGLAVAFCAALLPQFIVAKQKPLSKKEDMHIAVIRALGSEVAVAKVPLPRGKKGVFLNAKGEMNQTEADSELRSNGPAIRPGMPVEITKITFKGDRIIFDINGGGKSSRKWYQHLEVGMGGTTQPISQQPPVLAYGSYITLTVTGKPSEVKPEEVKKLLASVLDFERHTPTSLYSPNVPPQFKEAIKKHEVVVGMDRDAVLSSKGPPDRKVREDKEGAEKEDWIYGLPPHSLFVTFDGDVVVAVKQY